MISGKLQEPLKLTRWKLEGQRSEAGRVHCAALVKSFTLHAWPSLTCVLFVDRPNRNAIALAIAAFAKAMTMSDWLKTDSITVRLAARPATITPKTSQ